MTYAIEAHNLTKMYPKGVRALDEVSFSIEPGTITGLLGRNGAGKTTLMQQLTGQLFATSGSSALFGEPALERPDILARTCFIQEGQRYPDSMTGAQLLRVVRTIYPNWDEAFAQQLIADFRLPLDRSISKKLSRGQLSTIGIVIGLASRAEITFFDEPYLGLDAVARQMFYDRLLADFAEHPRTILMSTHHIDEAANLFERVIVLDQGEIIIDEETENLRGTAVQLSGRTADIDELTAGLNVVHRQQLGSLSTVMVLGVLPPEQERALKARGIDFSSVSLQNLIVQLTAGHVDAAAAAK
ncbi:ABC transporter ATP-binding protein [Humidisolicoccus flavus]|uniref:ABC transporter ATP-binding protein n=1 Tax=Humidisolicoccus flavus TaxID=3111414 RepID=UPI0032488D3D